MWIMLSVLALCSTFVWFCLRYLQPYERPSEIEGIKDYEPAPNEHGTNIDDVIKEMMGEWTDE